ncbi:mitochondrial fission protein ELM1 isoform X2 [Magnolia sinica]|uniref:mitochondrial fission protein ELM1 isoform X2 n=1 Tax=Magnolia sinica TaxID=86752 RepID=UPI0026589A13|nr:mitochondrial fission protein ELM1 isoform X2 [Magnolia sinica]
MRVIKLPEPPSGSSGMPEIFEAGVYNVIRRAVIISNGFAGAENQSIGLVRALGLSDNQFLYGRAFASGCIWSRYHFFIELNKTSSTPKCFCCSVCFTPSLMCCFQIQHPRTHLNRFDLVVTPRHDYYLLTPSGQQQIPQFMQQWITPREPPDRHVVLTVGALHQADSAALRIAATAWHDELAPLPKPLLVVNIGGPTSHCRYGVDLAKQLAGSLHSVLASCGSIRISFSRRTPQKVSNIILKEFGNHPKFYIWNGEDPNPHMGHLAWADAFVITADSVSMLSEACSTGKPVYVIGAERCTWKFSAFHKALRERGVVRPLTGKEDMLESWSYPPLNDAAEGAARVREALADRGWTLRR